MSPEEAAIRTTLEQFGQDHLLQFWSDLTLADRDVLMAQLAAVDFPLMQRLTDQWVLNEPAPETFDHIVPVPVIPEARHGRPDADEAWQAGEDALRHGRVGVFLVAGGQGTRLGFSGPKGAYPIGPVSHRSLFEYHADKIHNIERRYGCALPWYIMVSETNAAATQAFFREHGFFGLNEADVYFCRQSMVPCVDEDGRFLLDAPHRLAMNPNGHGGCIPAIVETGVLDDARRRGVEFLSYFQVDNWAAKIVDPFFVGYHVLRQAQMSSKVHRKNHPREAVGVHCLCDGEYRVIEYSELDIYPQLMETDDHGNVVYYAGNPAIHILSVGFVADIYNHFIRFPWHRAHKRIPYIDARGRRVEPDAPNGFKFETFVFDALRFVDHRPVALEIDRPGEYTPTKSYEGVNSVVSSRNVMRDYWAAWFEAAGCPVPRDAAGHASVDIEISPRFAFSQEEFLEKTRGWSWTTQGHLAIGPDGRWM